MNKIGEVLFTEYYKANKIPDYITGNEKELIFNLGMNSYYLHGFVENGYLPVKC